MKIVNRIINEDGNISPIVQLLQIYKSADIQEGEDKWSKDSKIANAPIIRQQTIIKWSSIKSIRESTDEIRNTLEVSKDLYCLYTEDDFIIFIHNDIDNFIELWLEAISTYDLV